MITPIQQDARRYLRRWATIAAAWAIATAAVVVWSIGGRDSSPAADPFTRPTHAPPQPITVTAQPTSPIATFGNPAPTRWPPPSPANGAPIATGASAQPIDIVAASMDYTQGTISECEGGRSIRAGAPTWWCSRAPITCGQAEVVLWPSITARRGAPQWSSSYCLSTDTAAKLDGGCSETQNSYGGGRCVLYFYDTSDAQSWQMASVDPVCGGPGQYGERLSEQCIHRNSTP